MSDFDVAPGNQLLSTLLASTYQRLSPYLEEVSLTSGQTVHESGASITEVYFPQSAIFSLVIEMADSSMTQVSLVGNEGLVGLSAILGGDVITTSSVVQISGTALKISTEIIRQEFRKRKELQCLILLYAQTYIAYVSQIAACNSLHNIEQRLARFLLLAQDCLKQKTLPLTQKSISSMLGVRRASITETAILLQKQQIIRYSRGRITIIDRSHLETTACECYSKIRSEYLSLLKVKPIP